MEVKSKRINLVSDIMYVECKTKELIQEEEIAMMDMNINDLEQLLFYHKQIMKIFKNYSNQTT